MPGTKDASNSQRGGVLVACRGSNYYRVKLLMKLMKLTK